MQTMASKDNPLIPLDVLFGNPDKVGPSLSPDGRYLSYVAPLDGVLNVFVRTVGAEDDRPVTRDTGRGIRHHGWAYNNRQVLYIQDRDGDENWQVFSVDIETGEQRAYTPPDPDVGHPVQAQLYATVPHRPDEMLIGLNRRDPRVHDVFHLDLATGELREVEQGDPRLVGWLVDHQMVVRGTMTSETDGGMTLAVRDGDEGEFREIVRWSAEDALSSGPLAFTGDNRGLYLLDSRGRNAAALVELRLDSGETRVLAEDERYDVSRVETHPTRHDVQAAAFIRARREWTVLDAELKPDFAVLDDAARGDLGILYRTLDDRRWLVAYARDDGPVAYHAYDREARETTLLFVHREALAEQPLATMEAVSFRSRDGLEIHGYLTRPRGADAGRLPLVLNVHGGPWVRDSWGFDPEAQWLANRGYACLQVNYRGSTGYGKAFLNAGNREWGGRMQDDLTDAVRWAIEEGIADPRRVAIFGGSYGGYATLAGVTFTPELYRAGVSIVGPSNLETFLNTIPPYWESFRAVFDQRVGRIPRHASGDKAGLPKAHDEMDAAERAEIEFIHARSPLFHAERVAAPMLIAQGANDPRVKKAESDQFVAAMREKGLDVDYAVYDDEGHGFVRPQNRLDFYRRAERFLARHLGGRAEEA
jgi:dipeptidyl aminopeptidase/acylaminoacyl peptidase